MDYHFFAKIDPRVTVYIADGRGIRFHDIGIINGEHLGLFSTNEQKIVDDLRAMIQNSQGGMRELNYGEYMELKKNLTNSRPSLPGREEIKNTDLQRARNQTQSANRAESVEAEPAVADPVEEPPVVPNVPVGDRPVPRHAPKETADTPPPKPKRANKKTAPPPPKKS